jgi:hypothetical protein
LPKVCSAGSAVRIAPGFDIDARHGLGVRGPRFTDCELRKHDSSLAARDGHLARKIGKENGIGTASPLCALLTQVEPYTDFLVHIGKIWVYCVIALQSVKFQSF